MLLNTKHRLIPSLGINTARTAAPASRCRAVLPNPAPVIFIEVLTKCQVPTEAEVRASGVKKQDNGDGEYERNDFDGNFPGGCGSCRGHGCFRLHFLAAIGV